MTSEVVVMNRVGVALAADSAVTVEMGDNTKVRESSLKLFALSKYRPVGVMVYNNNSLLGVPLETIIKMFRRKLGRRKFDSLREYGEALIGFLDGNAQLFPRPVQNRYFLLALKREYQRIGESVKKEFVERGLYSGGKDGELGADYVDAVNDVIAKRLKFWQQQKDAEYFSGVRAQNVVGQISGEVHELVNQAAADWPPGSEAATQLYEIARLLVAKDHFPVDVRTGLVIAGFGEKEHFPAVQHLEIGGLYDDRLKFRPESLIKVSEEKASDVRAFGYEDMVNAFLDGISQTGLDLLGDAAEFIKEMPVLALEEVADLAPKKKETAAELVRRVSTVMAAKYVQRLRAQAKERRHKIERAVETLTIDELAQVASTFVGLSSFEHRMSWDRETVGGPVDVAVISKGDGFVWIDRKQYFRKELNPHFFRNYYDDDGPSVDGAATGNNREGLQDGEREETASANPPDSVPGQR